MATYQQVVAGALTFVGNAFGLRIRPVDIYLDAAPSYGVNLTASPSEDVSVDIAPSAGIEIGQG